MTSALFNGHAAPNGIKVDSKPNGVANGFHDPSKAVPQLRELYTAAGQGHVFQFYDSLQHAEQAALLAQLASIDVNRVNRIYRNAVAADQAITPQMQPIPLDDSLGDSLGVDGNMIGHSRSPSPTGPSPLDEALPLPDAACASIINNPEEEARWRGIGLQAIADNQVAVLLMAGGQGTRLGSALPKGMYDISLPSGMSLFEIQAGRIKRLQTVAEEECGKPAGSVRIKWYVMTSGPTRKATQDYFEGKGFFGLDRDNVVFFEQGE